MVAVLEPEATPPALSFFELQVNNSREAIIENIRANLKRGLPGLKQHEFIDTPLAIVAGGPSLHNYLPLLKAIRSDCHVLSVNGAYKFLRSVGVESDHFVLIDSRRENVVHVDAPHEDTKHWLASQVHPAVFDALANHDVAMFHLATEAAMEATSHLPDPKSYLTAPVGMASVHAVYLGAALGYRNIFLFGYDFSHKPGESYAFEQQMNKSDEAFVVTLNGKEYTTTMALARTAEQFAKAVGLIAQSCQLKMRLFCDGLLPDIIRAASEPATEETERLKYEQMWSVDTYRNVSCGLRNVDEAVEKLGMKPGATLADFGCGTGRCVKWFRDHGLDARGVDIAGNALEEDVPFTLAALWDVQKLPRVEYGFSVDVMEHIPTDKVDATLRAIYEACSVGCYLDIDTLPDAFGINIGKTLHLTVQPAEWWEARVKAVWPHVETYVGSRQVTFVCRKEN